MWVWAIIGLLISEVIPNVNNYGHFGGLLGGIALGFILPNKERTHENAFIQWSAIALITMTIVGFGLSFWQMWPLVTT